MTPLRIAYAGTPEFALPPLHALAASRHTVVGVLTQPDRPSGRGRKLTVSPVKQAALELGFPLAQPLTLKNEAGRAALLEWRPDLLVVVAYGLILPREVLALPRHGCVNIHASLLPRWRGAAPIQRAILAGDSETGITIMQMDVGLDTGPVLLQRRVPIRGRDTSASLHVQLSTVGAEALLEALEQISRGAASPQPQPKEGATYAAKIEKSEALIDWGRDALEIDRKIRAFSPWPIAETRFAGEPLRVHSGYVDDTMEGNSASIDSSLMQSGMIEEVAEGAVWVRCGRGRLAVTQVQRPGRRAVSAIDFAHSFPLIGHRFG